MQGIKIKDGGQLERVEMNGIKKLQKISIATEEPKQITMWLNEASLTYLSIDEAIEIRNALNEALTQAIQ